MEGFWTLPVIIGPFLLGIALAYGVLMRRRRSRTLDRLAVEKTRQNYAAEEAEAEAKGLEKR
jgi:hypothetical protein